MWLIFTALVATLTPAGLRARGDAGLVAITGAALSAHVRFLADDLLEGRGTGTRGHAVAARYLATQLERLGVEPGARGSFLQPVPLRGFTLEPARSSLTFHGKKGKATLLPNAVAFGMSSDRGLADVEAGVTFAGFGLVNRNAGYDDVGLGVRGRVAVILGGTPDVGAAGIATRSEAAVRSVLAGKVRLLGERGAVAVIVVRSVEEEKRFPWTRLQRVLAEENMTWLDGDRVGTPLLPTAAITMATLDKLLAFAGREETAESLFAAGKAGRLQPFAIALTAHLVVHHRRRDLSSENVVGILRGGDPELARQMVVYTAHLDHLGIGEPVAGDSIYNGADDDAAGVAALIELARAFAALPSRPARSIMFVGVTAEEMGLRGSDYFARHPPVPLADLVADINLDAPVGYWELHDLVAMGAEHSTLHEASATACGALGLQLSPDPTPEQVYFIRSDQYSFVKQGVPSIFPGAGYLDGKGKTERNRNIDDLMRARRYHQPADEWDEKRNWEFAAQEVRADFLIGLAVAEDKQRPRWNPGDPFAR